MVLKKLSQLRSDAPKDKKYEIMGVFRFLSNFDHISLTLGGTNPENFSNVAPNIQKLCSI